LREYNSSEKETTYKYLGTTIDQGGRCKTEIQIRIGQAWEKGRELTRKFKKTKGAYSQDSNTTNSTL